MVAPDAAPPTPDSGRPAARPSGRRRWPARDRRAAAPAALAVASFLVLFAVYSRLVGGLPVDSDQANLALQAKAILGGNPGLHGWWVGRLDLYFTDLLAYLVAVAGAGLGPAAVHAALAGLYALLVVTSSALAAGSGSPRLRLARASVTTCLMLVPEAGEGTHLLLGRTHVGTAVLVLAAILLLSGGRDRALNLAGCGLLLCTAVFSDQLALAVGVLPIAAVALVRMAGRSRSRPDAALLAVAAGAGLAGTWLFKLAQAAGGFTTVAARFTLNPLEQVPGRLADAGAGLLQLFGAAFWSAGPGPDLAFPVVHLVGVIFAAGALALLVRALRRDPADLVTQALAAVVVADLGAYLFATTSAGLESARFLVPAYAAMAVLAGRVGTDWILAGRSRTAVLVAAAYIAVAVPTLVAPAADPGVQPIAAWLAGQGLDRGYGQYWDAASVTVVSHGQVQVWPVLQQGPYLVPAYWATDGTQYSPSRLGGGRWFIVWEPGRVDGFNAGRLEAVLGPPLSRTRVGAFDVMVWGPEAASRLHFAV